MARFLILPAEAFPPMYSQAMRESMAAALRDDIEQGRARLLQLGDFWIVSVKGFGPLSVELYAIRHFMKLLEGEDA